MGIKVSHREGSAWADFAIGDGCYLGLIYPHVVGKRRIVGSNAVPVFWTDDADAVFEKVKKHQVKIVFEPEELPFTDYRYYCFQCYDTEGNLIEVANYQK